MGLESMFTAEGLLLLVQVDHLCGEILGSAIESLYAAGARNVQALPSVTKKGRPGHTVIVDAPPERAGEIERAIARELGSTGWHRLATGHRHVAVEEVFKDVLIDTGSETIVFRLRGKRAKGAPSTVRPEHGSCLELQRVLRERAGIEAPVRLLLDQARIALALAGEGPARIEIGPALEGV
jgi:uncharacterized protein (DUF111 family)